MNKELIEILMCIDAKENFCLDMDTCIAPEIGCSMCIIRNRKTRNLTHYPTLIIQIGNHLNE